MTNSPHRTVWWTAAPPCAKRELQHPAKTVTVNLSVQLHYTKLLLACNTNITRNISSSTPVAYIAVTNKKGWQVTLFQMQHMWQSMYASNITCIRQDAIY
jgi:hypothetical protein